MMKKKYVALTFDDGPNNVVTPCVLDRLEKYGAKATFMVIGLNITDEVQGVMDKAKLLGCEFANHSFTHKDLMKCTDDEVEFEVRKTQELIKKHTGQVAKFFRAPFLRTDQRIHSLIDLTFVVGKGSNDWDPSVSEEQTNDIIINQTLDGDIILLHDSINNMKTARSLDVIIPTLKSKGFEFVTVTQLFEIKGVKTQNGVLYDNVMV